MMDSTEDFDKPDFGVDIYIKQLVKECIGGPDLQQRRKEIQTFSDQTSAALKKHVYANYMQFIETAKEISHLESEMYQLSHILIEQRNLLASLTDEKGNPCDKNTSDDSAGDSQPQEDAENNHATRAVKEMVHGFRGNLEGKTFLNEGALIELDANDYRPIQRVFFFLFNDVLIMCKVKHDKRLEFLAEYDPRKIAVINIKDLDGVKNAINIITPDGSKIFQSITATGKAEWIEKLEVAFRFDQQQKKPKKGKAPQPPHNNNKSSKQFSLDSPQSDNKSLESTSGGFSPAAINSEVNSATTSVPEWLSTATEDIQTLLAQRHFEDAHALIKRAQAYCNDPSTIPTKECVGVVVAAAVNNNNASSEEFSSKLQKLETNLIDILLLELSNAHCRNLQVALRTSRLSCTTHIRQQLQRTA